MLAFIKNLFAKPVIVKPMEIWTEVELADIGIVIHTDNGRISPSYPEYFTFFGETELFCQDFGIGNYRVMRKQCGFYNLVIGYKFRYEEDAMAFKLRFGQ